MERVDLAWEYGKERLASWRHSWRDGPYVTVVELGRLADGRWYAFRYGHGANRRDRRDGACVYAGERGRRLAQDTARRWRRCLPGEWVDAAS